MRSRRWNHLVALGALSMAVAVVAVGLDAPAGAAATPTAPTAPTAPVTVEPPDAAATLGIPADAAPPAPTGAALPATNTPGAPTAATVGGKPVTIDLPPGATLVADPRLSQAAPSISPQAARALAGVRATEAATATASGEGTPETLGDGALPPGPLPEPCSNAYTWASVDELRWYETATGRNCWVEKAPFSHPTNWWIVSSHAAGSTVYPYAQLNMRIDGVRYDGSALQGEERTAAWQNVWDNLFDYFPFIRGMEGEEASPITGYQELYGIIPPIDNDACYDPARGYNYGRWKETCSLVFGSRGPYYGVGEGNRLPWSVFGASVPDTSSSRYYKPAVFNCTSLGCPGPAVWRTGYMAQLPLFIEPSPYAGFGTLQRGVEYTFVDASLSDYTIVGQEWDFGDGTTSTELSPKHQYRKRGQYTVRYTVTASNGQRSTTQGVIDYQGCQSRPCIAIEKVTMRSIPKKGTDVPFEIRVRNVGDEPLEDVTAYAEPALDGSYTVNTPTPPGRTLAPEQASTYTVWVRAKKATGTLQLAAKGLVPSVDEVDTVRTTEAFPRASLRLTTIDVSHDPMTVGNGRFLTASVVNDGNVALSAVNATVTWDQPSVVTPGTKNTATPTSLEPEQTGTIKIPFDVIGNGEATATIVPTAKVGTSVVQGGQRARRIQVGGAAYTVKMATTPKRPLDEGTLDVTITNEGDVALTPSLDAVAVDRNGLEVTGVPQTLAELAPGASTTVNLPLDITEAGGFTVVLRSSATRATGDPLRRIDDTVVRIGADAKVEWTIDERYAEPGDEATTPEEANPASWGFTATATEVDGSPCDPTLTGTIQIDGVDWASQKVKGRPCTWQFNRPDLDKFTLGIALKRKGKPVASGETEVEAKDYLIISVGDSLSSGEGVPRNPGANTATWDDEQCHRSFLAGSSAAAAAIEADDPHSAVTFVHLACSGAKSTTGLLRSYEGIEAGTPLNPQLSEARRIAGKRTIDALQMTIGINDMRFGDAVKHCIARALVGTIPCEQTAFEGVGMESWWQQRQSEIPSRYLAVDQMLGAIGVDPGAVLLYEYPDPTKDEKARFCPGYKVEAPLHPDDWEMFDRQLITPLNAMGDAAAAQHGWTRVGGIRAQFTTHGVCSKLTWMQNLASTIATQGDPQGAFHPDYVGHSVYGAVLTEALRSSLGVTRNPPAGGTPPALTASVDAGSSALPADVAPGDVVTIDPGTAQAETRRAVEAPAAPARAEAAATEDGPAVQVEVPWTYDHGAGAVVMATDDLPDETGVNRAPATTNDTLTVAENTPGTIDVLGNDSDPNPGDTLSILSEDSPRVSIVTNPTTGKQRLRHTGVPPTPDCPDEVVHVSVVDQSGASTTSTLTVEFTCAPTAARVKADVSASEGNGPADTSAVFTVQLTAAVPRTVTVQYATEGGSAVAGTDYRTTTGALVFAPGETSKEVTVPVIGDRVPEPDESFTLRLTSAVGAAVNGGGAARSATISNDDVVAVVPAKVVEGTSASPSEATVTLRLSSAMTVPVTVDWSTAPVSATTPADFATASGSVAIPAGSRERKVKVPVVADGLPEGDETFAVNAQIVGTSSGVGGGVTIVDDDASPQLAISDAIRVEGDAGSANLVFTVTLSGTPAPGTVRVNAGAVLGTASATDVNLPSTTTLTFPVGTTERTFAVAVKGDTAVETNETVRATLSSPSGAVVADGTGTGTIVDDDAPLTASISDASLTEQNGQMTFTVSLSRPAWATTKVDVATSAGTATSGGATPDFTAKSGSVSFAAGDRSKTFTVGIKQDTSVEPNETFTVSLSKPLVSGDPTPLFTLADATGRGTIVNDDGTPGTAPGAGFSVSDATVVEGTGGNRSLQFTVSLSARQASGVQVTVATAPGTATAADFTAVAPTVVNFAAGTTSKTVNVALTTDAVAEGKETLQLVLSAPTGGTVLWDANGTGTIVDDDLPIALRAADALAVEGTSGTTPVTITVTLAAPAAAAVAVAWATADGTVAGDTATVATDYVSASGTVTIPAGSTTATFTVAVVGDTTAEAAEAFSVELSTAAGPPVALVDDTVTIRIADEDV